MCLIALAIPVQGMAVIVMPPCAGVHHMAAQGVPGHSADEPASGLVTAAAACHPWHIELESSDHSADAGHHDCIAHGEPGDSDHGVLKCCSANCSMAALTAPHVMARAPLRSPAPLHPLAHLYRGVTPDGLDRPPKLFLA